MSESSSNMSIDRLSALPDPILSHILSFLEMKDAAITSMLSKRWKFLWKSDFPRLVFRENFEEIYKFVARVHRTLVMCSTNSLDRFEVDFCYDNQFECDVNVWIDFAVRNKVKNVHLRLDLDGDYNSYHLLPQIMYSNPSLTSLLIHGCILAPRGKIEWQSLTELHIEQMELSEEVIKKIFSGCPVLKSLYLVECWGFKSFNHLEINSASVYKLVLDSVGAKDEDESNESLLEISAPFLKNLKIYAPFLKNLKIWAPFLKYLQIQWCPYETEVRLTNMASLVQANVGFAYTHRDAHVNFLTMMKELYQSIAHVKELVLDKHWLKALSTFMRWRLPPSKQVCLKVNNLYNDENNIVEIMGLLESSPKLEMLTIMTHGYSSKKSIAWRPPARDDLDCDLLHLKTVRITDSGKPHPDSGLVLNLARNLLKRATVLEKMVIVLDYKDLSDVVMISEALLAYPRSSTKALVILRQKH